MTPVTRRRGGRGRYRPQPAAAAIPLARAGLYAVHVREPSGATTQIYYCEPASGRCSCAAAAGSCAHVALARGHAARAERALSPIKEAA